MKKRMICAIAVLLAVAMLSACGKKAGDVEPTIREVIIPSETAPAETKPSTAAPAETTPATDAPQVPEVPVESKEETIRALNAILIGMGYYAQGSADVSQWTDAQLCENIYSKLLRESDSGFRDSYLRKLDTCWLDEIGERFDLEAVKRIARDAYGREFPADTQSKYIRISGNEVHIDFAAGESTEVYVQDFLRQGSRVDAVGIVVHKFTGANQVRGYFHATFEENPSSIYGYTMRFYNIIPGNQSFGALLAGSSTALVEGDIVHNAKRTLDGDLSTAWVEGVPGVGIQEWIKLETVDGSKMEVAAIEFALGYHKSEKTLDRNGYPTELLIETEAGSQKASFYWLEDVVVLDQPASTSWIKITILDAEAGSKYEDTCISEIRLHGIDTGAFFLIDGQ